MCLSLTGEPPGSGSEPALQTAKTEQTPCGLDCVLSAGCFLLPFTGSWSAPPSPLLPLQLQPVGDHGDELGIRRLALGVGDGISEVLLEGLQVAPIPGHLNGMADGPLHPAGGGAVRLATSG